MATDAGKLAVDHVFDSMQIDREWSVHDERGYTWWPGELAQRVWAEPPRRGPKGHVFDVRAETYLLRDVAPCESLTQLVSLINANATLSALVHDQEDHTLRYVCSMVIHEQNVAWAKDLLSLAVAIQAADATIALDRSELLGGIPAVSAHPESGFRSVRDDMINIISHSVAPRGAGASPFSAVDLSEIEQLEPSPAVLTSGGGDSLTAEFPFNGARSSVEVAIEGGVPETALLQISCEPRHPKVGSGCLFRLTLPVGGDPGTLAMVLNRMEALSATDAHLLGAWCASPMGPTFVTFVPAVAHRPGLVTNLFFNAAVRTRWARTQMTSESHF